MKTYLLPIAICFSGVFILCACDKKSLSPVEGSIDAHKPGPEKILKDLVIPAIKTYSLTQKQELTSSTKTRTLLLSESRPGFKLLHYYVIEKDILLKTTSSFSLLTFKRIEKDIDLFSLVPDAENIVYYDPELFDSRGKGKRAKLTAHYSGKRFDLGAALTKSVPCEPGQQICIDWYWTTYNEYTGQIISELFLYTTCHNSCASGGGEIGIENAPSEECNRQQMEEDGHAILDAGSPISESHPSFISSPESPNSQGEITRTKIYPWDFYRGTFLSSSWKFTSYAIGIHKKIGKEWFWKSFSHSTVGIDGAAPFEIGCVVNASNADISADLRYASLYLYYTVKVILKCKYFSIPFYEKNQSSTHNHSVDK